jgi:exonuclease SbcC
MKIVIKKNTHKVLEKNQKKIKYVVHLSDIHIRKNGRIKEFRQVFNNLFIDLKKLKLNNNNTIIVVTGDIMHDKSVLTGESVNLLKEFFIGLTNIATTVCIIGNHDINLNSKSLDSVSPVIGSAFDTKHPVYTLLDDCVYEYNNIRFGVTTIFTDMVTPCKKKKGKINIGLYHGMLNGCSVDTGLKISNTNLFKIKDFKQYYDYTLLGDIHRHQYLDKEKTIWYVGSVLQQNRGESLKDHGFELLNLETKKSKFHRVKNDYGFLKVIINDDGSTDIDDALDIPSNIDIKVICKAKDRKLVDNVYKLLEDNDIKLTEKSHIIDYSGYDIDMKINGSNTNILDLRDKSSILKLFKEYMKINVREDTKIINRVMERLALIVDNINYDKDNKCKKIKLCKLEFKNLMIFGKDNMINFDNLKKVVGLSGENNIGKSALIDIILFSIFGCCTRGSKPDYIRIGQKVFESTISLDVNGKIYKIIRSGKLSIRKDGKEFMRCETANILKNGIEVSKDTITQTNIFISNEICTINEMVLASIVLQNSSKSFLNLSNNEKKSMLCNITRIEIFDKILEKVRSDKNINGKLQGKLRRSISDFDMYGNDISKIVNNIKNKLVILEKKKKKNNIKLFYVSDDRDTLNSKITEYATKIKMLNKEVNGTDVNKLHKTNVELKNKMLCMRQQLIVLKKKHKKLDRQIKGFIDPEKILQQFEIDKENEMTNCNIKINELCKKIDTVVMDVPKNIGIQINTNGREKSDVDKKINLLMKDIDNLNGMKCDIEKVNKRTYSKYVKKKKDHYDLNNENMLMKQKLEDDKIMLLSFDKHEYDEDCDYCVKNSLTQQKLETEKRIYELTKEVNANINSLSKMERYMKKHYGVVERYENMEKGNQSNENIDKKVTLLKLEMEKDKYNLLSIKNTGLILDKMANQINVVNENNKIELKIKNLQKQHDNLKSVVCETYLKYKNVMRNYDNVDENINNMKTKMDDMKIIIDRNGKELIFMTKYMDKINKLTPQLKKASMEFININAQMVKMKKINEEIDMDYRKLSNDGQRVKYFNDEMISLLLEREEFDTILNMLKNNGDGIVDNILENKIIPRLEHIVNDILECIDGFTVRIMYSGGEIQICDNNKTKISMNGGYINHSLNMVFRVALSQINNYIKTNFMIIDEAFDNCSDGGKKNVIKLIDQMKSYYDFILIISHDLEIKTLFDKMIYIKKIDECSKICIV